MDLKERMERQSVKNFVLLQRKRLHVARKGFMKVGHRDRQKSDVMMQNRLLFYPSVSVYVKKMFIKSYTWLFQDRGDLP